ncbi:MAG TPA: hypothetical protein VKR79_01660 [Gaiellaceae bacterium]|nr:hypothetical protein [Gaiellaceae bacterium]
MRVRSRIALVLLAAGLVAVAAGCGGGGGTTPPTTAATSTQQTTTGSSNTSFASAKNCRDFSGLAAKIASAISKTSGNPATELQTESQELQALATAAPAAIRSDFQTFATAFASYLSALEKAGYKPGQTPTSPPSAAQLAALVTAAKVFSTSKLTQAETHLAAWAAQNCK